MTNATNSMAMATERVMVQLAEIALLITCLIVALTAHI